MKHMPVPSEWSISLRDGQALAVIAKPDYSFNLPLTPQHKYVMMYYCLYKIIMDISAGSFFAKTAIWQPVKPVPIHCLLRFYLIRTRP